MEESNLRHSAGTSYLGYFILWLETMIVNKDAFSFSQCKSGFEVSMNYTNGQLRLIKKLL